MCTARRLSWVILQMVAVTTQDLIPTLHRNTLGRGHLCWESSQLQVAQTAVSPAVSHPALESQGWCGDGTWFSRRIIPERQAAVELVDRVMRSLMSSCSGVDGRCPESELRGGNGCEV